jgi:hypothetical protein
MGMKDGSGTPNVDPKATAACSDAARATAAEAEVRRLQAELAAKNQELAAKDEQIAVAADINAEMAAAMPMQPLDDPPEYELLAPFFTPDCVLLPEGTVFRDLYGVVTPNEQMVALNPPAEARMDAYLASLPGGGTPSLDAIIDSAYAANPDRTDDPQAKAAFYARVLEGALLRKYQAEGRLPPGPGEKPVPQRPKRPQRLDPNTPIMGHTRIKTLQPDNMFGAASRVDVGPAPGVRRVTEVVR